MRPGGSGWVAGVKRAGSKKNQRQGCRNKCEQIQS